jgi:succinylarginine dihydrolase
MARAWEVNFDGLVGPTHNYAGLSYGNVASMQNKSTVSSPKQAALQGLAKMQMLARLGVKQAILPPHERPHVYTLRKLGFTGSDAQMLDAAHKADATILASVCSASSMWAANAATVSPSPDTADGKLHFTPANLISQFHRSIEPPTTARVLKAIFPESAGCFVHHPPLPAAAHFSDEGAANHTRLCGSYGEPGVEVFVFGRRAFDAGDSIPRKFPARQTYEACAAIARHHQLRPDRVRFVKQNPSAIDAGAFHNDVVSVGNLNLLLRHTNAYGTPLPLEGVTELVAEVPFASAVSSYIFNSQLVRLPDGKTALIAPVECRGDASVQTYIDTLRHHGVTDVHYVDVRQSMQNGGGPACLRLRVVLNEDELAKTNPGVIWTEPLHERLVAWINDHYRDELRAQDLPDPKLLDEGRAALDELSQLLKLGNVYEFQGAR